MGGKSQPVLNVDRVAICQIEKPVKTSTGFFYPGPSQQLLATTLFGKG